MRVLLCNDDGYRAEGLRTLAQILSMRGHDVTIVAPEEECSGQSHAMTFFRPLLVRRVAPNVHAVRGTPADCVYLGLSAVLAKTPPDLVIAGINHGVNVGLDVNYSGTVGAATEAAFLSFRAMAVSMDVDPFRSAPAELSRAFERTAALVAKVVDHLSLLDWPERDILNLNHPGIEPRGVVAAECQPHSIYIPHLEPLAAQVHPRDDLQVFVIGGTERALPSSGSHDVAALQAGDATLSFLRTHQGSRAGTQPLGSLVSALNS
ncbi:5'/3'-nucleotidase SurE [Myxococcus fulvus]|uniref:5'/3'-nucleotidase SurE n=1 Tax=Myxococcus fulvus TaxID=33 RepID=UPI003B9BF70E